jgi:transposase-like protein
LADDLIARAQAEGVQLLGEGGLLQQMTKAVLERGLQTELTEHLGYEAHDPAGRGSGNSRNGSTGKRLLTEVGPIDLEVPATVPAASSRSWSGRASAASMASTRSSSGCMRAA